MCSKISHISSILVGLMLTLLMASAPACSSDDDSSSTGLGRIEITASLQQPDIDVDSPIALTLRTADGSYEHTWADIADFPQKEPYLAGSYIAIATCGQPGAEGFDCACFADTVAFDVADNQIVSIDMQCRLTQAVVIAEMSSDVESVTVHTSGCGFITIAGERPSPAFITPGKTQVLVSIKSAAGGAVTVDPGLEINTAAGKYFPVSASYSDSRLIMKSRGAVAEIAITEEMLAADGPSVAAVDFDPQKPIDAAEGIATESDIIVEATAMSGLRNLHLTTIGTIDIPGYPSEVNLLDGASSAILYDLGLTVTADATSAKVDFSHLIEAVSAAATGNVAFIVSATDALGRISPMLRIDIAIFPLDFEIVAIEPAVVGVDVAEVVLRSNSDSTFAADDFSIVLADGSIAPIVSLSGDDADPHMLRIAFAVPAGTAPLPARIDYLGTTKASLTIPRATPDYDMDVDAFATLAVVAFHSDDREIIKAVTRYADMLVDGNEAVIYSRDIDNGIIVISGLTPQTQYTVSTVIIPGQYTPSATLTTEEAAPVPEGDFEEYREEFKFNGLLSGGIYSTTVFPVYNRQNTVDIVINRPVDFWAGTNAKTFCTSASNANTWYMQPSAELIVTDDAPSGTKVMKLTSVGWDLDGTDIEPYLQLPNQSLPYNANVPAVAHRSAGKIFLGKYHFDPGTLSEKYTEGVQFSSRPSSLNGFFKYTPCIDNTADRGFISIAIFGTDISGERVEIARGRMEFPSCPGFRSFNIPLQYNIMGVKASELRIMAASSVDAGSIADEDADVVVSPNPAAAAMIGSTLYIDNLSFSY